MAIAMGVDLGRKHDSSAICVVERDDKGTVRVLAIHELKKTPFADQIAHIRRLADRYKPSSIQVDSTGLGLPVVEELHRQLGAIVVPVSFTAQSKAELVSKAVVLLQDRKLRLPRQDRLRDELHSVTRQVTKDGTILYRVAQKYGFAGAEYHHADLAWSLMLAIRGIPDGTGFGTPIFTLDTQSIMGGGTFKILVDEPPPGETDDRWPRHIVISADECYWDFGPSTRDWWASCADYRDEPHRSSMHGILYHKLDRKPPWQP